MYYSGMLGRAETSTLTVPTASTVDPTVDAVVKTMTSTAARPWTPVATPVATPVPTTTTEETTRPTTTMTMTTTTTAADHDHRGRTRPPSPPPTGSASSWPSSDWILETMEQIEAVARARGIRAGGAPGVDPFDYDDGGDDDDDDDAGDEIEEIEEPTTAAPATVPPPPSPRIASGHMSRYLFRRIDGRPGDGRVNGTYVAVVESDRPPRGVVYDTVSTKLLRITFSLIHKIIL